MLVNIIVEQRKIKIVMYHDENSFQEEERHMTNNDMLNKNYKKACLNQTKRRLNDLLNKFLDDENIDSNYKSRIIDMIVGLLTLKQS